jgi:hypothetical protein
MLLYKNPLRHIRWHAARANTGARFVGRMEIRAPGKLAPLPEAGSRSVIG